MERIYILTNIRSRYRAWSGEEGQDTQIDLLIDRADQTVNVCETRFAQSEHKFTKSV